VTTEDLEFGDRLRRLAAVRAERLDGQPSDRALAKALSVSPTTVGSWLRGGALPKDVEQLVKVVEQIQVAARVRGVLDEALAAEFDLAGWRAAHRAAARRVADRVAVGTSAAIARSALTRAANSSQVKVIGVMPALADCFQARGVVDDLAHATDDGGTAVLTGTTPMPPVAPTRLLSGMGGVGKTQLAVNLAHHLYDTEQLDLLVWISAVSRQAITSGYASAAVDLVLPGADGTDTERDAARFHAWLATTDRRWLVVLDDLATTADLKGLWPPARPMGRTLVTTRLRGAALSGPGRHLVTVGVFTPLEAAAYVCARLADHPDLADDVDGLAAALYHLPLALAHATAYLIDEDIPCTEYQRRLAEHGRQLDELAPPAGDLPDDYTRTVATTVSLSVRMADQARPAGLATPLLRLASVLNSAGIPESVFTTEAARSWLACTRAALDGSERVGAADLVDLDAVSVRSGLRVLHRFNLITATASTIAVHGLVQRVAIDELTRSPLAEDELAKLTRAAADALVEAWPAVERDPALGQAFRDNTAVVRRHGRDSLLSPELHRVLFQANRSLGESGDAIGAAAAFEELVDAATRVHGPDHSDTLTARSNVANYRGEAGNALGAALATEQLLADRVRLQGPDHPDTLVARGNLASWRGRAGDAVGAAAAYKELLDVMVRVHGPGHPDTLITRGNLASWRGQAGDAGGAAAAYEELLVVMTQVHGPDHPSTLITRNNLCYWRGEAGDVAGAALATEQLVADRLRVLGPDHPDILVTRSVLANLRGRAGDIAAAVSATELLLADQVRVLALDHPDTLATHSNLAYWRGEAGDAAGAAIALVELQTAMLRVFGPDHPHTLANRGNLASWRGEAGDAAGAATAFEELLDDQLRLLGPDHSNTLATRSNLASWRAEAGDAAGAAAAFEELLVDRLRVLGADHPDTLTTRNNLAHWRGEAGDAAGAAAAFEELLVDRLRVHGADHPDTLATRNNLAHWRGEAGDGAGAAAAFAELLEAVQRALGPAHPYAVATRSNLAHWQGRGTGSMTINL
jgi:hypothetical protein